MNATARELRILRERGRLDLRVRVDGNGYSSCASPKSYIGLADGVHTFEVRATDAARNADQTPASRTWTVDSTVFVDDFDSGSFAAWSLVRIGGDATALVQSDVVKSGAFSAKLSATANIGSFAYARAQIDPARAENTASGDFQIAQEGVSGGNVPLLRLFDSSGTRIVSLYHQNLAGNKIRVTHSGVGVPTTGTVPLGTWGHFDLYVLTDGTASTLEVRLNGAVIYRTTTASLGTAGVASVQIGNDTAKQPFTLFVDNVSVRG